MTFSMTWEYPGILSLFHVPVQIHKKKIIEKIGHRGYSLVVLNMYSCCVSFCGVNSRNLDLFERVNES